MQRSLRRLHYGRAVVTNMFCPRCRLLQAPARRCEQCDEAIADVVDPNAYGRGWLYTGGVGALLGAMVGLDPHSHLPALAAVGIAAGIGGVLGRTIQRIGFA